jgi:hypothetical protein
MRLILVCAFAVLASSAHANFVGKWAFGDCNTMPITITPTHVIYEGPGASCWIRSRTTDGDAVILRMACNSHGRTETLTERFQLEGNTLLIGDERHRRCG